MTNNSIFLDQFMNHQLLEGSRWTGSSGVLTDLARIRLSPSPEGCRPLRLKSTRLRPPNDDITDADSTSSPGIETGDNQSQKGNQAVPEFIFLKSLFPSDAQILALKSSVNEYKTASPTNTATNGMRQWPITADFSEKPTSKAVAAPIARKDMPPKIVRRSLTPTNTSLKMAVEVVQKKHQAKQLRNKDFSYRY